MQQRFNCQIPPKTTALIHLVASYTKRHKHSIHSTTFPPLRQGYDGYEPSLRDHHLRSSREDDRGSPWGHSRHPRDPMGRDRDRSPPRHSPGPRQSHIPRAPSPPKLPSPQQEEEEEEEELEEEEGNVVTIDDLVNIPGRFMRPPKIVIVLRGPPGAGKTTVARMIKVRG